MLKLSLSSCGYLSVAFAVVHRQAIAQRFCVVYRRPAGTILAVNDASLFVRNCPSYYAFYGHILVVLFTDRRNVYPAIFYLSVSGLLVDMCSHLPLATFAVL